MRSRRAWARAALAAVALGTLWIAVRRLPVLHWIALGAVAGHDAGAWGAVAWGVAMYALTLLLFPVIPLVVASGWLFGLWGALVALPAAVASASTAFAVA